MFRRAANQFKLGKRWPEAAEAFQRCSYCAQRSGSLFDEASFLVEAGNMIKKVSTSEALPIFERAIAIHSEAGRFAQSAKLLLKIAEAREAEMAGLAHGSLTLNADGSFRCAQHAQAKEYYERAAEFFEMDDHGKSNLSKCNLKIAEFMAKEGKLREAIQIFENEGRQASQCSLRKYGARELFLRAGILHMASGDSVATKIAVESYSSLAPGFESSREGKLLVGLVDALENQDSDLFVEKLCEYDSCTKIDAWKTAFLLKVKNAMAGSILDDIDLT